MADFTIKTPYRTTIHLDRTPKFVQYRDLYDGTCFEWQGRPGEVFERQDSCTSARLLPWDNDDYYDMTGHERVIILKTVFETHR